MKSSRKLAAVLSAAVLTLLLSAAPAARAQGCVEPIRRSP